jgi:hypothetical protein
MLASSGLLKVAVHGLDFTSHTALEGLVLQMEPQLIQGRDFTLVSFAQSNGVPQEYKKSKKQYIGLRLAPGKTWVGGDLGQDERATTRLFITASFRCSLNAVPSDASTVSSLNSTDSKRIQVATILHKTMICPQIQLPDASPELKAFLDMHLKNCQIPRIVKSKRLDWRNVNSLNLLVMDPPLFLVDGSDQDLESAARDVDSFLAAHSVLEIAWEPFSDNEPKWWVLVPRPKGMPGHYFAMLDYLQWHHPHVADWSSQRHKPRCNASVQGCTPGCAKTRIKGITGSGWGADTGGDMS